jgi:hypothetical protein
MENKESFEVMDRRPISLLKAAEVSLAENSSGECFVTDGICFTDRGVINGDVSALK